MHNILPINHEKQGTGTVDKSNQLTAGENNHKTSTVTIPHERRSTRATAYRSNMHPR
jgi:hypothetical protein